MKIIEGNLTAKGLKIALVASRFNSFLVEQLVKGAADVFTRLGGDEEQLVLVRVPGAYLACRLFPQTLLPMGLASAAGSLLSVIVCLILFRMLQRKNALLPS